VLYTQVAPPALGPVETRSSVCVIFDPCIQALTFPPLVFASIAPAAGDLQPHRHEGWLQGDPAQLRPHQVLVVSRCAALGQVSHQAVSPSLALHAPPLLYAPPPLRPPAPPRTWSLQSAVLRSPRHTK
jgi:hypothetical protein